MDGAAAFLHAKSEQTFHRTTTFDPMAMPFPPPAARDSTQRTMKDPTPFDQWLARWGWKIILILATIAALVRAWQMWQHMAP
jgi:hypothetical protein